MTISYTTVSDYAAELKETIKGHENGRAPDGSAREYPDAYGDTRGIPTIGNGFNMRTYFDAICTAMGIAANEVFSKQDANGNGMPGNAI